MPKPKVHFMVCGNRRPPGHPRGCCADNGAGDVLNTIGQLLMDTQSFDKVKVNMTSCLGPCSMGTIVVVYPDNVWYGQMDGEKAKRIWDSHVNEGKPVPEFELPEGSF